MHKNFLRYKKANDMKEKIKIGLIGDYCDNVRAHIAIPKAFRLISEEQKINIDYKWLLTDELDKNDNNELSGYDGFWCVPASPYKSLAGALKAIRFARENDFPFLGTCGGFQHCLIEIARNVSGLKSADHAESNPEAGLKIISPLSCSLVGQKGKIKLIPGTRAWKIYGKDEIIEEYHCSYGLNNKYVDVLLKSGVVISGNDADGDVRIIELPEKHFFIATLFQPELAALNNAASPLITEFVSACSEN
jgi:CTP synthase (UTP-ammonia lyase)